MRELRRSCTQTTQHPVEAKGTIATSLKDTRWQNNTLEKIWPTWKSSLPRTRFHKPHAGLVCIFSLCWSAAMPESQTQYIPLLQSNPRDGPRCQPKSSFLTRRPHGSLYKIYVGRREQMIWKPQMKPNSHLPSLKCRREFNELSLLQQEVDSPGLSTLKLSEPVFPCS